VAIERDHLTDFLARIDPHRSLWQSLEFAYIAVRRGSDWIVLAGRAELSTLPCGTSSNIRRLVDLPNFRAYHARLKPMLLDNLTTNLADSGVITGMPDDPVRLNPGDFQAFSWWQEAFIDSNHRTADGWPTSFRIRGTGAHQTALIPDGFWQEIDTQLFRNPQPYSGLAALCAKLALEFDRPTGNSYFDLCASVPARFVNARFNRAERSLCLTIEYVGTPDLIIEWLPQRDTVRVPVPRRDAGPRGQTEVPATVPIGSTRAEAKLLVGKFLADSAGVRIEWDNTLLRIADFFDTGHKRLEELLWDNSSRQGANLFELGIARLLGLAGFDALWFGKASAGALPDVVAYWHSAIGKELIVLGECTIKDPLDKFADLAKRARDFSRALTFDQDMIVPVIFSRAVASGPEFEAAGGHSVALCDGNELRRLHDKIRSGTGPELIFEFLKFLRDQPSV